MGEKTTTTMKAHNATTKAYDPLERTPRFFSKKAEVLKQIIVVFFWKKGRISSRKRIMTLHLY